jgi:hypothetical protein
MATVSSVPTDLSSEGENLASEMVDCVLTSLVLAPFCRQVALDWTVGGRGWLITVIAHDRPMTDFGTCGRVYSWEAVVCPSDPRDFVDVGDISPYVFETPIEALADATQFLAEHRAVPEPIPAGVA